MRMCLSYVKWNYVYDRKYPLNFYHIQYIQYTAVKNFGLTILFMT